MPQPMINVVAECYSDISEKRTNTTADNVMYVAKQTGRNRYFVDRRQMPRAVRQVDRPDMKELLEEVPQAIRTDVRIKDGGKEE